MKSAARRCARRPAAPPPVPVPVPAARPWRSCRWRVRARVAVLVGRAPAW